MMLGDDNEPNEALFVTRTNTTIHIDLFAETCSVRFHGD